MQHHFHPTMLREYDIRGIIGETLGADDARAIGRAFGTMLRAEGGSTVAVGYDGRVSSPMLEHALVEGLTASGCDVVRIGLSATPMLYYAEASAEDVQGGIQITGSHNPANHNAFKIVLGGLPVCGDDLQHLGRLAAAGDWLTGQGRHERRDVLGAYVDRLTAGLAGISHDALAGLRIGWDAGNGAAGPALERLTQQLPGEHHLLFTQVDGSFPNHHPDPPIEAKLDDLRALVAAKSLHFGVAFDGDGDRLGVVTKDGEIIFPDRQLMLFAEDVLSRVPGGEIIYDVKCTRNLAGWIKDRGGKPTMWNTGHALVKAKLKETGAPLAGEMSGHVFFKERWYGFDDGLYTGARLLEIVSRQPDANPVLKNLPNATSTPELNIKMAEGEPFALVDKLKAEAKFEGAESILTIDGVRVEYADGFGLARPSNTTPVVVLRFEADNQAAIERIQADFRRAIEGVWPGVQLPF